MRNIFYLLVSLLSVSILWCGCVPEKKTGTIVAEKNYDSLGPIVMSYIPAREGDTVPRWGLVRADGSMLFSDKFETTPSAVVNGFFSVKEGSGISVYKAGVTPTVVSGLTQLAYAGVMSHGLMPVSRFGKRIELVDGNGMTKMTLNSFDGREIVKTAPYFVDDLLAVCTQDGLWGAINTSGEMVVEPVYLSEPQFSERVASVSKEITVTIDSLNTRKEIRHYLINNRGKIIYTFNDGEKPEGDMCGGRIAVRGKSGVLSFLAAKGGVMNLPVKVSSTVYCNSDYTIYKDENGNMGLLDAQARLLMPNKYKLIDFVGQHRFLVSVNGRDYALVDSVGGEKVRFSGFDNMTVISRPARGIVSPFVMIGFGHYGMVLLDERGRRLGAGAFVALSLKTSLLDDGYVYTGYFNVQNVVHTVVSKLTDVGWDKVAIGGQMPAVPDSVKEKATVTRSLHLGHERYYLLDLDAIAYSDKPVMLLDSITDDGKKHLSVNVDSKVKYVRVEAAVIGRRFSEMIPHLRNELVPHGFKADKISDEYAVYSRGDRYIIATSRPRLEGMYLYVMDLTSYNEFGHEIISDGVKMYNRATR